jgi:puromycin-sensitive aminopeptidase
MPETSSTHVAGSSGTMLKKVVFDTSPKMSTYLLAWAVGEFDFVQGVTKGGVMLRVFSPPGRGTQGQFALDVGIRALDFFDHFFNVCGYNLLPQHAISKFDFALDVVMHSGFF